MSKKTYTYCAVVVEGLLYEINVEDGIATTFDCCVEVILAGGKRLVHRTFYASGRDRTPEGWDCVGYSRDEAQAFADRVNARGWIDLSYWEEVPAETESLEERWDGYAREEQIERNGGRL